MVFLLEPCTSAVSVVARGVGREDTDDVPGGFGQVQGTKRTSVKAHVLRQVVRPDAPSTMVGRVREEREIRNKC